MIHITNIRGDITKKDLETVCGRVGVIKIRKKTNEPNVWIGDDGREASVTYDDPLSAQTAVEKFNGKDIFDHGSEVTVKLYSYDHEETRRGGGRSDRRGMGSGGRGANRG
jgi:hypothetical protein